MYINNTFVIKFYPDFLFIINDIYYEYYFRYTDFFKKIFKNEIMLNDNKYIIKGIICMPSKLHYNCYLLNNTKQLFEFKLKKHYFMME